MGDHVLETERNGISMTENRRSSKLGPPYETLGFSFAAPARMVSR